MLTWLCVSVVFNAATVIVAVYFWLKARGKDSLLASAGSNYEYLLAAYNRAKHQLNLSVSRRVATCDKLAEIRKETQALLSDIARKMHES